MLVRFNTKGYDDFIDFIKAYAIICVILSHTLIWHKEMGSAIWLDMQVPLFVLVQAFHFYKKDNSTFVLSRVLKRVLVPFLLVEIITFALALMGGAVFREILLDGVFAGGYGPGSYYPWIYLQVAFLLPLFSRLVKQHSKLVSFIIFLVVCEGFEIVCSIIDIPDFLYRLLAIRYIFLFWLGFLWVRNGVPINGMTVLLAIVSLMSIVYFEYYSVDDEPWFYNTGWKYHRWPCYYWVAEGLTALLYGFWRILKKSERLSSMVRMISRCSYEIFLVQMSSIYLIKQDFIVTPNNDSCQYLIWLMIIWSISFLGGFFLNKILKKWQTANY